MITNDTEGHLPSGPAPSSGGKVDFTFMYAAHSAFRRDLHRLTAAVEAGRTADPAVRSGWATLKNQLYVHHTAEDAWLWPALRDKVTMPSELSVLDMMEAEHARIDPLLAQVDDSLAVAGPADLAASTQALTATLAAHMEHEENHALPLVETYLGPEGWAAFRKAAGRSQGLSGGAELFPWMLDGAGPVTTKRVLSMLPAPARLLYRAVWRPGYARTPRWGTAATVLGPGRRTP
jgi:hemerythrin HHE cation binding domain-containing protein